MAFAEKAARNHLADDQLVVAGSASIRDPAIKKGQSILEDGRAAVHSLHIHIRKSRFLFREAPAEMNAPLIRRSLAWPSGKAERSPPGCRKAPGLS